jgi:hypothetical protein
MKPNDKKDFMNGKVSIKVNSMYPAGQGYSPRIIDETHFNISFNGHNLNITESAFNEMLRIFEPFEDIVIVNKLVIEKEKDVHCKEEIVFGEREKEFGEISGSGILSNLQTRYVIKFAKPLPPRYKNDIKWIEKALAE